MGAESNQSVKEGSDLKVALDAHNIEYTNDDVVNHGTTPQEERAMVRKMDLHIFPIVIALYILDVINELTNPRVGNARLYGLEKDLGLKGDDYQLCVSVLFITYVSFEMPANLLLKMVQPRRFIPITAFSWGLVFLCIGFVQNKTQSIAVQLLLDLFEAGYFPAICFYLTFFYRRRELALRIFFLFAASTISGSTGGLLAYTIGFMDGIPTILLGIVAYFILSNDPQSANYLTERDKELCKIRSHLDGTSLGLAGDEKKIDQQQCFEAWKDWKVWTIALAQHGVTVMLYGYHLLVNHHSGTHTQLLTIPCYAAGAVVYLCIAYFSDKTGKRGIFAVGGCLTACLGYGILLGTPQHGAGAQYAGCVIVAAGLYVAVGIPISWMPNNLPSHFKRAAGQGTSMTVGNCAGIYAAFLYRTNDSPEYKLGHGTALGFVFASGCLFGLTSLLLRRENKKRDRGERDHVLEGKTPEEIDRLGDYNPEYRYIY
ncbi:unnamed protein product [Clonostachys rosea]|uniref:Major facilitator superfamily (MFS) profile domain-containing protein n=1 Tax=Bionectria ochroleuca TaxID=29856 RepID=A0ABY6UP38_BIOOC|nr:unnamed protein product [Clonostachys rosea]